MDDIHSRLRNWRQLHLTKLGSLMDEAADEIARLRLTAAERTAIQRLIEDYEGDGEPASAGVVATLRALLERTK